MSKVDELNKYREQLQEIEVAIKRYCQDAKCVDTCPECELNKALAVLTNITQRR